MKKHIFSIKINKRAQSALEYFILLGLVVGISVVALSGSFMTKTHKSSETFFQKAAESIIKDTDAPASYPGGGGDDSGGGDDTGT